MTGLEAPYCYGLQRLLVKGEPGPTGERRVGARYIWPALDGTDLIFSCNLPPGHWTFVPARPHFATFPPEPLLVEASAIKGVEQDSPIEVTIRATLAQ